MKLQKNNLKLSVLLVTTAILGLAACSSKKSSDESSEIKFSQKSSAGIVGGNLAESEFQKKNGIVQLLLFTERLALDSKNNLVVKKGMAICTGSLVARDVVLTAAHCLTNPGLVGVVVVFAGSIEGATKENLRHAVDLRVNANFDTRILDSNWNDIALIKLSASAPEDFQLAALPSNFDSHPVSEGSALTLAGFGITNPVVRQAVQGLDGKETFQEVPSEGSGVLRKIESRQVVGLAEDKSEIVLDQKDKKGACHGDSGGPAYLQAADGSQVLVGVTSRGTEALGNCTEKAIYTSVAFQLDWIKQNIDDLHKPATVAGAK